MINFEFRFGGSRRRHNGVVVGSSESATSLRMTDSVHRQIMAAVGTKAPENGMLLGGDLADGVVRHVVFDDSAERTGSMYSPDHVRLNRLLAEWWGPSGIRLLGFVHSHPGRFARPSGGDLHYARAILGANPHLSRLLMPIVPVEPEPTLHPFVVVRSSDGVEVKQATIEVINEVLAVPSMVPVPAVTLMRSAREETFRRVAGA